MNIGTTLGHYRIVERLGSGGMGEVYLAHDTRLGRNVALKTLLPHLAEDQERRTRFEREARAVAALNHPNIVTIHSIESGDGVHFITMEHVPGQTLTTAIPRGGLPLKRFFELALPLTDAVSVAHDHGITHRDLKPHNVMITTGGVVKVLDFGLAKLRSASLGAEDVTQALSDTRALRGQVLGTVAYMSPEQAEGVAEIDHRSDIFSLGILLHEMLTGQRPFRGESTASILSSLLRDTPAPITDLRPDIPPRLARMVQRCLEKDPSRRYQSAADLRNDLADLRQELDSGIGVLPRPARPSAGVWAALALLAAIAALAAGYWLWTPSNADVSLGDLEFVQLTHAAGQELFPTLSPDGRTIAYASAAAGNFDIYSQRVGGENPVNLTKDSPADDTQPAFSADGERLAFRSEREGGGIFVAGATGESVRRVTSFGYHPAWSPDGRQLAVVTQSVSDPSLRFTASQLWIVNVDTGAQRLLGQGDAVQPSWSPSGRRIAYWSRSGPIAAGDIWTISAEGGDPVAVTTEPAIDWNPAWSGDGRFLYFSSNRGGSMNLWRIPIDERTGETLGRAQPVTTGAGAAAQHISVSRAGDRIAYVARVESQNLQRVAFDPVKGVTTDPAEWITRGSRAFAQPHPSPDGRRLAFNSSGKQEDIFIANADGAGLRQLTDDPHIDRAARWSPDGTRIAFYSDRTGAHEIWSINPDGSGRQQLTQSPGAHYPVWSPDGRQMAYSSHSPNAAYVFDLTKPWGAQKPKKLPAIADPTLTFEIWGWSPDGRRLAGQKHLVDLSHAGIGIHELGSSSIRWLTDFGEWPVWLRDSRRLLFSDQGKLFLIDSDTGKFHEVLALAQENLGSVGLAHDDRTIYYTVTSAEADVWLITIK